jgi:hypothetical protein
MGLVEGKSVISADKSSFRVTVVRLSTQARKLVSVRQHHEPPVKVDSRSNSPQGFEAKK